MRQLTYIFQRNGIYQIQYEQDGRTVHRSLKTDKLRSALEQQKAIEADMLASGGIRTANQCTVGELVDQYLAHANEYYRKAGLHTSQYTLIGEAVKALDLYDSLPVEQFGPNALRAVRETWIGKGVCRTTVNKYQGLVRGMFKWGVSHQLVPVDVYQTLATVEGLRRGRTTAPDYDRKTSVPEGVIEATKAKLPPLLRDMIDLQTLTGARPTEMLLLKPCEIDRSGPVWEADITARSKTEHHNQPRFLYFGPKAQQILRPYLLSKRPDEYLFNPRDAIRQRNADCKTHRHQPVEPPKTDRSVGDHYDASSYRKAIYRAVADANKERKEQGLKEIERWNPHRLRHNAGTLVRRTKGLDGAQVFLGHANADVTQIYTDQDRELARRIAAELG
jgi:integrase